MSDGNAIGRRSFLTSAAAPLLAQKRRRNLILILIDDHRFDRDELHGASMAPHAESGQSPI